MVLVWGFGHLKSPNQIGNKDLNGNAMLWYYSHVVTQSSKDLHTCLTL